MHKLVADNHLYKIFEPAYRRVVTDSVNTLVRFAQDVSVLETVET